MQDSFEKTKQNSLLGKWLNRKKKPSEAKGIKQCPEGEKIPLSLGQQRLLFLQHLYPENPFYHYCETYKFKGNLNLDSLLKSFEIVAKRHDILRTKVVIEDGQAFQQKNDNVLFEVSEYDLKNLSESEQKKNCKDLIKEEARKSLDSPDGYLTRISILHLKDEEYLIALTMHHIIADKWSMPILRDEIAEYYQKLISGKDVGFVPLEIQYGDYAYWQSLQKTSETNINYWKSKLENCTTFLDLPTDFHRPIRPTFLGEYSTQTFSSELSEKIEDFCKQTNKTLFVVMLTAYKVLLKLYSGETDILVGSPFTNRDEVALEKLIGFFNDTLVLRSDLSNDPTFNELLEQVWSTTQEAFAHKQMPFETLVKALKIDRHLNFNPLFQAMFTYSEEEEKTDFGKDLEVDYKPFDLGVTKFDLTLFVGKDVDKITASFEYAKDLFDMNRINRMHGHFKNILKEIITNPDQRISELSIITNEELELFSDWNETNSDKTTANSIIELFDQQVKQTPQKSALSFQNDKLTYEELNKRANSVANYLVKLNLKKEKPIGLLVEPSTDMLIGILGILKAGFAYLPLDAEYPKERIDFILKDSSASVVLTQKQLLKTISTTSLQVETIDKLINSETSEEPILSKKIEGNDLAYVIYTSGSTGKPKGVSVTHKNLVYSTSARFDFYTNQPEAFLLLSSFSFDSSVVGIFWTLAVGGKIVLVERRAEQDLNNLSEVFVVEKITHTLLLPSLYSTVIKNIPTEKFASFKTIIVAGEACPKSLCREHFEFLPELEFYNEYGPTEATVWAIAHKMKKEDAESNIPIGKPISGTQIYILDSNQNRVPIGVTGELYIGGTGVAKGYFNNYELTNKRFVMNKFAPTSNERLYRTGDLCRYRTDGTIDFLGRKDDQVKIRGFRIELGEIQETIKQTPVIQDVVVRVERRQEMETKEDEMTDEILLEHLEKMNLEDANETLSLVEQLSDKEVDFMLNETA